MNGILYPFALSLSDHDRVVGMFPSCVPLHSVPSGIVKIVDTGTQAVMGVIEYPAIEWASTGKPVSLRLMYSRRNQDSSTPVGTPVGMDIIMEEDK